MRGNHHCAKRNSLVSANGLGMHESYCECVPFHCEMLVWAQSSVVRKSERSPTLKENPPRVHSVVERYLFSEHVALECFDQHHWEPRSLLRGSSRFSRGPQLLVHCSVQGLLCHLEFNCCSLFEQPSKTHGCTVRNDVSAGKL